MPVLKIGSTINFCTYLFKVVAISPKGVVIQNRDRTTTITHEQATACLRG